MMVTVSVETIAVLAFVGLAIVAYLALLAVSVARNEWAKVKRWWFGQRAAKGKERE